MPIFLKYDRLGGDLTEVKVSKFPDQALNVRLPFSGQVNEVVAVIKNSDDLVALILVTDALERAYCGTPSEISLVLPYTPYARQDRVCNEREPLSLKAIANVINWLGYRDVQVWDAHSYVAPAVIERCTNLSVMEVITPPNTVRRDPGEFERYLARYREKLVIVAPDAGAEKRANEFAKFFELKRVLTCSKVRNPENGEITGVHVNPEPGLGYVDPGAHYLIVDDICDGGRTFIEIGKAIFEHIKDSEPEHWVDGTVDLFVTHGIFSKGIGALDPYINTVFCTNSLLLRADLPPDALLTAHVGSVNEVGLKCA